jgi:holo-[acyl-carrier protein] synthase
MITFGIGTDIQDIARFELGGIDEHFLTRVFTTAELGYCMSQGSPPKHLAARFAGKEAVVKALLSLKRAHLDYRDIEITNDESGTPSARITKAGFEDLEIKISLSHSDTQAIAFAIVVVKES